MRAELWLLNPIPGPHQGPGLTQVRASRASADTIFGCTSGLGILAGTLGNSAASWQNSPESRGSVGAGAAAFSKPRELVKPKAKPVLLVSVVG